MIVVQRIIDKINATTYLEIGVRKGDSFLPIHCPRKIAVDPKPIHPNLANNLRCNKDQYFQETSDDFFNEYKLLFKYQKIDVALIDGEHSYRQSLKDVENVVHHLSDDGFILLHDCNPRKAIHATPIEKLAEAKKAKEWDKYWNGDVYKTIIHLRANRRDLTVFVLDCDWGLGIVKRGQSAQDIEISNQEILEMDYAFFDKHREKLLNLKAPEFFNTFMQSEKFI